MTRTVTADDAAAASVEAATRQLSLPAIREHARRLATQAQRSRATYLAFLADTLSIEVDERTERRRRRLIHEARFPRIKRIAEFNFDAAPTINPATIATLAAGTYLDNGEPVVLLGNSGTGKTHLLIGLGIAACEQGRRVRYTTSAQLVNELVEAADDRRLARLVARYGRFDLVCVDELGYVKLDSRGAELLFQVLTEREEKNSIATASNLPFSEWGQIITDPRLVAAVIDRLTFNAHIIETGTDSYRLRLSHTRRQSPHRS
jgi:DNA replication protein DnaC